MQLNMRTIWGENKWKLATFILAILTVTASVLYIYRYEPFSSGLEITDELGGNIFPVTILSTATTDAQLIVPADSTYLGNPKSCIGIKIRSPHANSKLHIELAETPFFAHSVSEFILPESGKEYLVFPDVIWNYQALLENTQAMPVTVSIQAKVNNNRTYSAVHTYSVRSINECLLGYIDSKMKFHDTGDFLRPMSTKTTLTSARCCVRHWIHALSTVSGDTKARTRKS